VGSWQGGRGTWHHVLDGMSGTAVSFCDAPPGHSRSVPRHNVPTALLLASCKQGCDIRVVRHCVLLVVVRLHRIQLANLQR
jgi:hypothetical protein